MSFGKNPLEEALEDYKAGRIDYKAMNAIFDAALAEEQAEAERKELEDRKRLKRKHFVSVSINIPLD